MNENLGLTRLRNAQLRILLIDAAMALRAAQITASWLCTEENMKLLADIDLALSAGPG